MRQDEAVVLLNTCMGRSRAVERKQGKGEDLFIVGIVPN